ncbi:hypothetical protein ACFL55_01560 [Candidatus Latescibacterota bacterium]
MIYLAGLAAVFLIVAVANRIGRASTLTIPFATLSLFKLDYFALGLVLAVVFPDTFIPLFEQTRSPVIMFCLSWIGFSYGCGLEIRTHQTYPKRTLLMNLIEPVVIFSVVTIAVALVLYVLFDDWQYTSVAVLTGVFCSFSLFMRGTFLTPGDRRDRVRVADQLLPLGNVFPVIALSIVSLVLFKSKEVTVVGFMFSGTLAVMLLHILVGIVGGILLNMLISGNDKPEVFPLLMIGCAALNGGFAYTFSLSPLFVGALIGAFLINATLKRLQVLEVITVANDAVEKVFMVLLGTIIMPLFGIMGIETVVIASFALSLAAFRMVVKYFISRWWASGAMLDGETSRDLWIGLVGQGFLASAAVIECSLQVRLLPSVFLMFVLVLLVNQLTIGLYAGLRNRPREGETLNRA